MGLGGQRHAPATLPQTKKNPVHTIQEAGWAAGPVWTGAPSLGFDNRTVQPKASRNTDWATVTVEVSLTNGTLLLVRVQCLPPPAIAQRQLSAVHNTGAAPCIMSSFTVRSHRQMWLGSNHGWLQGRCVIVTSQARTWVNTVTWTGVR